MSEYQSIWTMLSELDFAQRWLNVDGVRTRVALAGPDDAPAVVMLHGTGGHWETFAPTMQALSGSYRCIAIDMVGNGFTDKPDYDYEIDVYVKHVLGVMELQGVRNAHFIGMSLGAWVAARIAQRHSEVVDRLILMSPAGLVATADNMARIRAERTNAVQNPTWESIEGVFRHLIASDERRIPDLIGLRQAIYRRPDSLTSIDHLLVLQEWDARERNLLSEDEWRSIPVPTMVVASGKDHGEYLSTARQVAALIPGAEVFEMPDVRHWPHFEDPESFNSAALAFLRR